MSQTFESEKVKATKKLSFIYVSYHLYIYFFFAQFRMSVCQYSSLIYFLELEEYSIINNFC